MTSDRIDHIQRSEENIAAVAESVRDDYDQSTPRRSQQLGLSYAITWRILLKDLGLKTYEIQLAQDLKPQDLHLRRVFCEWALEQFNGDPLFYRRIILRS